MFQNLSSDERGSLLAVLASAVAACSGRQCGRIFTENAAERATYGAMADEMRPIRDETI